MRQEQYRQRILAMLNYMQDACHCRSRLLLEYFGETHTHDCGQCDVCQQQTANNQQPSATSQLLQLLHHLSLPTEAIDKALRHLMEEEYIINHDGFISLAAH